MSLGRCAARALVLICAAAGAGCAHAPIPSMAITAAPTPLDDARAPQAVVDEMAATVDAVVAGRGNGGRFDAVKARVRALALPYTTEAIDWLSTEHNTIVALPPRAAPTAVPRIVYVVAHADKIDTNPLVLPSILLDGVLGPLIEWSYLSEGAVDNATGVAVALSVARAIRARPLSRVELRVLVPQGEELGLRGSRAHAARLREAEWARLAAVINVDGVGIAGSGTCVSENVSDAALTQRAHEAAAAAGVKLEDGAMPPIGSSDYESFANAGFFADVNRSLLFNLTGALLPQRSYFAREHHARVVNYLACEPIDAGDLAAAMTLLPLGSFHGPRDNRGRVDRAQLYVTYRAVLALLRALDADAALTPPVSSSSAAAPAGSR